MRHARPLIAPFLLLASLLAGCASLGLEPAQGFDQKLAYAYGTHTAILKAGDQALTDGSISVDDAKHVLAIADQSREVLDAAKRIYAAGDKEGANAKLLLATQVLSELQTYLRARRH